MSDPPKKWGVMRSRKAGICNMPLFDRMTGRSRPHLSLREGSEQPPRSGAESPASPIPSTAAPPFPSPWMIPDRSSPSRVRFAASRPGLLRADPKDALLTRGKGASGRGARSGGSVPNARRVERAASAWFWVGFCCRPVPPVPPRYGVSRFVSVLYLQGRFWLCLFGPFFFSEFIHRFVASTTCGFNYMTLTT